jgi:hypothetical protein
MKQALGALSVALCLAVSASPFATAFAGESLLGTIIVTDAGTSTNRTTGWGAYAGTGSFVVKPLTKISIQCDQASLVLTDVAGVDAGTGIRVAADQAFPTSVNTNKNLTGYSFNSDGGVAAANRNAVTYNGGWVAVAPITGNSISYCRVYSRKGDE